MKTRIRKPDVMKCWFCETTGSENGVCLETTGIKSGVVNMYGASPMLTTFIAHWCAENPPKTAAVLASWMNNYDELVEDGVIQ